ncbi:zinc ABC transporter substrate-binding protein [Nocardiopsis sp. RSe5-2]|uniref:Zinc ABC transporter substrate-binding protein n=1 Tax=Nocardiopsis endophytica TaxID=3018445 RepID=A0ABT4TZI1_9ACTN|nr:zinc ABC transporter substrate-binding protein [Nocardiopsis endophytica]MDA2810100.1 zinc ABC transporter substrate-binding protein [Nocardiopsis endophytica]
MRTRTTVKVMAAGAAAAVALTGCGNASGGGGGEGGAEVTVVTGVYPLQWLAEQVGGDRVAVSNLTEPGTEPHDLELTGRQTGEVADADVVFYVNGLQPAVDDAVAEVAAEGTALDVADLVELRPNDPGEDGHDEGGHDEEAHGDEGHAEEGHGDEHAEEEGEHSEGDGHEHGELDPHMWLDTGRMAETADGLADRLAEADPDGADAYRANAEKIRGELEEIGGEYDDGLAECDSRELVVNHSAFGYLADAHDLEQIGISGLDPETEPSPARIAEVADLVKEHDVTTVFTETLVSPAVAETIADEAGAQTAVLDPIEGITDDSPGDDYPSVMRANLETLREGLGCS